MKTELILALLPTLIAKQIGCDLSLDIWYATKEVTEGLLDIKELEFKLNPLDKAILCLQERGELQRGFIVLYYKDEDIQWLKELPQLKELYIKWENEKKKEKGGDIKC